MKHFNSIAMVKKYPYKGNKVYMLFLTLVVLVPLLNGCNRKTIDDVINEVEDSLEAVKGESSAWRDEIPKLVNDLEGLESQVNSDVKGIVTDTKNQAQDLATQTIQLSDAKAQDLIAQAGVEFRCNTDFVRASVIDQLQYLVNDLKFWKQNKQHLAKKPNHAVCWINPTVISLYPSGNSWSIDTSNMSDKNIVRVFGYNFLSDALPTLELQDANGQKMRDVKLTPTYVTHYQMNLDFSNEDFTAVQSGATVIFRWPDQDDPNTINLTLHAPAKLKISNPIFTPSSPTANKDGITLKVTVTNQGDLRSDSFIVFWKPDPEKTDLLSISRLPLNPGESADISISDYVYQRGGTIDSTIYLSNGDDALTSSLTVAPPPVVSLPPKEYLNQVETVSNPNVPGIGHGEDKEYGGDCDPGYVRSYHNVIVESTNGNAAAWVIGWADPNNIRSCKLVVHYSLARNGVFVSPTSVTARIIIGEQGE